MLGKPRVSSEMRLMRILLDTNLLILALRLDLLPEGHHVMLTAALCYAELQEGEFSPNLAVSEIRR
ncbi:MAG: hypothetical protein LBK59_10950 [Bifidobacteriaceae bacterium]|nr:hypothetical protein [Bifidobacteriaceae bacterium]